MKPQFVDQSKMRPNLVTFFKLLYITITTVVFSAAVDQQADKSLKKQANTCLNCATSLTSQDDVGRLGESGGLSLNQINYIDKLNSSFALASNSSSDPHVKSIYLSLVDILSRMDRKLDVGGKPEALKDHAHGHLVAAEANNVPLSVRRLDGSSIDQTLATGKLEKVKRNIGYTTNKPNFNSRSSSSVDALNTVDVFNEVSDGPIDQMRDDFDSSKKPRSTPYSDYGRLSSPESSSSRVQERRQQQQNYANNGDHQYHPPITTTPPPPIQPSGGFSPTQSSHWRPSGKFNSELEPPSDKPLFTFSTPSSSSDHQQSQSFMSTSIKEISDDRPPEEDSSAARFNTMLQNFKENEFPLTNFEEFNDGEQVMQAPQPPRIRSPKSRHRRQRFHEQKRRPIPLSNYADRGRKPSSIYGFGSTNSVADFHMAPSKESQLEHEDYDSTGSQQSSKLAANFGELQEEPPIKNQVKHMNQGVYLQQVDTKPLTTQYSFQYQPQATFSSQPSIIAQTHHSQSQPQPQPQPQKVFYALLPQTTGYKTSSQTTGAQVSSTSGQPQAQPQTIQITAVPSLGINNNSPALVRLSGLNNWGGGLLGGSNGLLDPTGRQVLMVNSERRLDWSWLVWPMAVVVALPLILSALFVPVFLKSMVIFLQILQSLGLVMPISSAINQHLAQGNVSSNFTHQLN